MPRFVIQPHGRLHEAVADENGYFTDEGLDYSIEGREGFGVNLGPRRDQSEIRTGAYESYVEGKGHKGQKSDISCACHWAVNQAAASDVGRMWGGAYVVSPGAIMVHPDSAIRRPEDLAGEDIAVGYHSGSHFSTLQALESFLEPGDIRLKFLGTPWERVDVGVNRVTAATSVWGITYQTAEQLGLRKIVDCSFMMAFMFPPDTEMKDITGYMNALKRAQAEIDLYPERYKRHYAPQIPDRYRDRVDVRRFGPGERIVFLPYTEETFARTQQWLRDRGLFESQPAYDFNVAVST